MKPALDPCTSEADFAQAAATTMVATLLNLLDERHPVYEGRSEKATVRMRGWVFSRLAAAGTEDVAFLPFLREELETGHNAYSVAAAAVALRRFAVPSETWIPLVEAALTRIRWSDDSIQFDHYPLDASAQSRTTATKELQKTLTQLRESDAAVIAPAEPLRLTQLIPLRRNASVQDVELEDHEGQRITYGEYLLGRPSFLLFFYTRCNNPNKCSANIARLGELQRRIEANGLTDAVNLAAITYDPDFDTPTRLRRYMIDRGVALNDRVRAFRVPQGFAQFQHLFGLQVNYAQTTVNQHAREAFLLDMSCAVAADFVRVAWEVKEVVQILQAISTPSATMQVPNVIMD